MPLVTTVKKFFFGYRSCQNRNANNSYLTLGLQYWHRKPTIKLSENSASVGIDLLLAIQYTECVYSIV